MSGCLVNVHRDELRGAQGVNKTGPDILIGRLHTTLTSLCERSDTMYSHPQHKGLCARHIR